MEIKADLKNKKTLPKKTNDPFHDSFTDISYYQALFEDAPIGVVLADDKGILIRVNKATCNMLGYSEDELIGMNIREISHPGHMKTNMVHRKKLIDGQIESFHMEKRYIHKDGSIVWGRLTSSILEEFEDGCTYLMAHLEDITDQ